MGNAYRSVLASGGAATPLTPSNSSPVTMTAGQTYTPTKNGKAVESVTSVTPSNSSPASLSTDTIYKPSETGYAIKSYSSQTPSASPQSVSSGSIYKMGGAGYTISSYSSSSKSPSSSGTYFSSGWNYMNSSGYAYSSQPSGLSETLLWSNSSPTSSWTAKEVTLSQNYTDFNYIKITCRVSTSNSNEYSIIVPKDSLPAYGSTTNQVGVSAESGGDTYYRNISYRSTTSIRIASTVKAVGANKSGGSANSVAIPIAIYGCN